MATRVKVYIFVGFIFLNTCLSVYCSTNEDVIKALEDPYFDFMDTMQKFEGGKFVTGINDPKSKTGEYPVRIVSTPAFYMDMYPVTVAQFMKYSRFKTRYRTTAEKSGYSFVLDKFVDNTTKERWSTESNLKWWLAVKGAQWNRPEGPGSHVRTRLKFPVVHVSYSDAKAYCMWAGKRLPTETEWEFAARGYLNGLQYPWGDRFRRQRMNIWQGKFPDVDKGVDGWIGISPVDAYPPQNDNSMYDMLGNVWEWTLSAYYERLVARKLQPERFVLKGGSYLDTRDGDYNHAARTANRMGQVPYYTAHNVGFRCALTPPEIVEDKSGKRIRVPQRPPHLHRWEEIAYPVHPKGRAKPSDFHINQKEDL